MKKFNVWQRLLSVFLVLALVGGILPVWAYAAEGGEVADAMVADPSTADSYQSMLGSAADGNRYSGRIWSDKSVYEGTGSVDLDGIRSISYGSDEFLTVYSALGSTTSVTSETVTGGNMDVVIVLDNSASMGGYTSGSTTRLESVTAEANELIASILENPNNRLAVVTYSTNATTILPLNFYEQTDSCLSVSIRSKPAASGGHAPVSAGDGKMTASATILNTNTKAGSTNTGYQMGTNLQSGINAAMKTLHAAENTDDRIPVVIVLTDGVADYAVTSGMIGDTTSSRYTQPISNQIGSGVALSTLLNAAYWKDAVSDKYGSDAVVYTVGVDIGADSAANVVMDPANYFTASNTNTVASTAYGWYVTWSTGSQDYTVRYSERGDNNGRNQTVTNTWTFAQPSAQVKAGIMENIAFADEYFNVTSSELSAAFDTILTKITTTQEAFSAITDSVVTEGDTPQTYVDFIGDYMEVREFKGMTLYGQFYEVTLEDTQTVTADGTETVTRIYTVGTGTVTDPISGEAFRIGDVVDIQLIHTYDVDADGNRISAGQQELWIRIMEEALPLIYHKVVTTNDVTTYTVYDQKPIRFYYTVGISDYIAPDGSVLLHRVDAGYLAENTENGQVYFYTNQYFEMNTAASGYGDAHTAATPHEDNRYYYHQYNNPLYISVTSADGSPVVWDQAEYGVKNDGSYLTQVMTYTDFLAIADSDSVYTDVAFHTPTGTGSLTEDGGVAYSGVQTAYIVYTTWGDLKNDAVFYDSVNSVYIRPDGTTSGTGVWTQTDGHAYVEEYINSTGNVTAGDIQVYLGIGSWRIPRMHNMTFAKAENVTGTAQLRVAPTLDTQSAHEGSVVSWLGNNGRLAADLEMPKHVYDSEGNDIDGKTVMVGDELTYEIGLTNYDLSPADITVTDTVPAGSAYVDGSASHGGVYDAETGTITWKLSQVAVGESVTVSFRVTVTDAAVDSVSNTAYVSLNNNPAWETNTTHNYPQGKSSASDNVTPNGEIKVGDILTYTIHYYNDTDATAVVTVSDTVPAGTVYVDGSATYAGTEALVLTQSDSGAVTGLTWTLAGVPAGASGSVSFRVRVGPDAVSPVENTATIQVGDNDPAVSTNTVSDRLAYGDLTLTKTVAAGNASGSREKYFTLVLYSGIRGGSTLDGTFPVEGSSKVSSVTFIDGTATLEIRHGQIITVQDLPAGITVSVYEQIAGGYTAAYSANSVKIVADEAVKLDVTNTYNVTPVSVTLTGTKELTGRAAGGQFAFLVKEGDTVVTVGESNGNGPISFDPIVYTAPGVHTYTVSEVNAGAGGITYDERVYTVTVTVTDNGAGALEAQVDYPEGGIVFVNRYTAESTEYTPVATKVLTGRAMEDYEFSFEVLNEKLDVVSTGRSKADGTIEFTPIGLTAAGTFTFTVQELAGNLPGVAYDTDSYTFTVTVTDDGQGNLVAEAAYAQPIVFTNSYTTEPVDVELTAGKILSGKQLEADEFRFVLTDADGSPVQTVSNGADGTVRFDALTFTEVGTYTYTIREAAGDDSRYAYDAAVYTATVTVQDVGGKLSAAVTYSKDGAEVGAATFYNVYTAAPVSMDLNDRITFRKTVADTAGTGFSAAGFRFEVYNWNGELVSSGVSDEAGNIDFEPDLEFATAGDYRFRVVEAAGDTAGVGYDSTVWIVHVTVVYDNVTGLLSVSHADVHAQGDYDSAGTEVTFANTYDPEDVILDITMEKLLTGRDLISGEFAFQLLEGEDVVAEAANGADGKVTFTLTYDKVGTFSYTVREVNNGAGGVTYDENIYGVAVTVTDLGGRLAAEVTSDDVTFVNRYDAKPVTVELGATKVLYGRELKAGEFTFLLTDSQGNVLTAVNDAEGNVRFEAVEHTQTGTWVYTITEKAGDLAGVTYSDAVYTVTVEVRDNGVGHLQATVSCSYTDSNGDAQAIERPLFYNVYEAEEPGKPSDEPQAGDGFTVAAFMSAMLVSVAALAVLVLGRKRFGEAE